MCSLPLVSIALCTYNGAKYLEKQIISIINQTYKNLELIIVDDSSLDDTFEIIERLASSYPQITYLQNSKNIGYNRNFEKAINLCTGKFIAISDQDDIWIKEKIQRLVDNIEDKWLIFSNSELMDAEESLLGSQILDKNFKVRGRNFKSLLFTNFVSGHTMLFSKDLLKYITPMPSNGYYDWWIAFVALYHQKIAYLSECLTYHRIHTTSATYGDRKLAKPKLRSSRFKERNTNLAILQTYKNLKVEDQRLIYKIHAEYIKKGYSTFLIKTIFEHYTEFFPDLKERHGLSRLSFALKFK